MGPGHGQSSATTLQFQKLEDKLHRLEKEKNDISQVRFYFMYFSHEISHNKLFSGQG